MPILDLEIVGSIPEEARRGLASRIAEAAGEVFASRPHGTWVKLHFVESDAYSENGGGALDGTRPVIARVLLAEPPVGDALAVQVPLLTRAIAEACGRPVENVHLIYEPPAMGRIAFGGSLRT